MIHDEKRPSVVLPASLVAAAYRCTPHSSLLGALHLGIFDRESFLGGLK
ncbi:hypothetical protein [Geoanaerobacter pelophilus]|nr:hypothetical protein [Geoanaerobacter pelophilus]